MSRLLLTESVVWGQNGAVRSTDQTKINTLSELTARVWPPDGHGSSFLELLCFLFQSESGSQIAEQGPKSTEFFFFFNLFLAALGLYICAGFLSSCCVRASHCSGFSLSY